MAATKATQTVEDILNPVPLGSATGNAAATSRRMTALKHRRIGLITVANTADTYAHGLTSAKIHCMAWEPEGTDDDIAVSLSGENVLFVGASASTGYLHIWSEE